MADRSKTRKAKAKKKGVMQGAIRGCDLWLEEYKAEVHDDAYGNGTGNALRNFTKARWAAWSEMPEEEKAIYNERAKELRGLVNKDGAKIIPRVLPSQYASSRLSSVSSPLTDNRAFTKSLGTLCRSFERKVLIETGAYVVMMYAARTTDRGCIVGL